MRTLYINVMFSNQAKQNLSNFYFIQGKKNTILTVSEIYGDTEMTDYLFFFFSLFPS